MVVGVALGGGRRRPAVLPGPGLLSHHRRPRRARHRVRLGRAGPRRGEAAGRGGQGRSAGSVAVPVGRRSAAAAARRHPRTGLRSLGPVADALRGPRRAPSAPARGDPARLPATGPGSPPRPLPAGRRGRRRGGGQAHAGGQRGLAGPRATRRPGPPTTAGWPRPGRAGAVAGVRRRRPRPCTTLTTRTGPGGGARCSGSRVAGVLGFIFVFTAFAGASDPSRPTPTGSGECVAAQAGIGVVRVPCDEPNQGRVVVIVPRQTSVPERSRGAAPGSTLAVRARDRWAEA